MGELSHLSVGRKEYLAIPDNPSPHSFENYHLDLYSFEENVTLRSQTVDTGNEQRF
jgi:hypothetical protein